VTRHAKKESSLFRRLVYFLVMVMTGGGAGIGGWFFKDHPQLKTAAEAILGKSVEELGQTKAAVIKETLSTVVSEVVSRNPNRPGVYKVRITELALDPKQFADGKTVDIQAEVRKIDADGKNTLVWESKSFGENLAVVGRDDLTVDWNNRPFEIEWKAGEQIVVAAWDRKSGFFSPKTFKMALPPPGTFPLATGPHAMAVASSKGAVDSDLNRIVFNSQRVGNAAAPSPDRKGSDRQPVDVAERPIIIR